MELLLIRHAEPNRVDDIGLPADPPLHERGRLQAGELAAWLRHESLDELWSSPMRRALETAAPLAAATGRPVRISDGLAEWDRRSNEYIPIEELKAANDHRWQGLISGETFLASVDDPDVFQSTVVACVEEIVASNPQRRVAVICHGGVINMYASWVLGLGSRHFFLPHYTSVTRIAAARSGERSIVSLNETGHLHGQHAP